MSGWLSATWEASWRPFQYFNLYRLVLAGLLLLAGLLPQEWLSSLLHVSFTPAYFLLAGSYMLLVGAGLLAALLWQCRFNMQLLLQVMLDVGMVAVLMYSGIGVSSGVGVLLLVSLATASLVGRGRLVLFYAALATLATLGVQVSGVMLRGFDPSGIVQAGFLSLGFFATAIVARLFGQRIMVNENLARQRGVSLENQGRISQRIIERMQDGVLVIDGEGVVRQLNPVAADMLGVSAVLGRPLDEVCEPLATALGGWLGGDNSLVVEFRAPDGGEWRARFERTASSTGEVLAFVEDLGRVKERAQQMKLAALGRLTASIAHEIRNPLSAISHAGELLHEERRGEMQDRLLKILSDNVARLDRIVADILELGRRDRMQPEPLMLAVFCDSFLDTFIAAGSAPPGVVVMEGGSDAVLCFDRNHLLQIVWNLTANAVRHARGGPGSVRLAIRSGNDAGWVQLHVIDDGGGVPESARTQIFEPFFTTYHEGTGLGLFIARELAEANGARLELVEDAESGHFVLSGRSDTCQMHETSVVRAGH
jgi:two-component system sensor histidine kinase PilS (NtrC family)